MGVYIFIKDGSFSYMSSNLYMTLNKGIFIEVNLLFLKIILENKYFIKNIKLFWIFL